MALKTQRSSTGIATRLSAFGRRHLAFTALVAVDVASKLLAFRLLPGNESVEIARGVGFYLTLNEWGVLGGVEGIAVVTANSVYTLLLAVALLGLAAMVRKLDALGLSFPMRLLVGSLTFLVVSNLVALVARPFAHVSVPPDVVISAIRAAALVVSLAFYSVSRAPMARAVFTLLCAGSLANGLSYAYPPFEVIDFVRIPLPGNSDAFAVINLADVYIALSLIGVIAWPLVALTCRSWSLVRRRLLPRRARRGRIQSEAAAAD